MILHQKTYLCQDSAYPLNGNGVRKTYSSFRDFMQTSRHISFAILAVTLIAGSTILSQHAGLFAGAFRTEILARVDNGDVVSTADIAAVAHDAGPLDRASAR